MSKTGKCIRLHKGGNALYQIIPLTIALGILFMVYIAYLDEYD